MYQLCNIEHTHSFSVEAYISMDSFANITGFLLRILVAGERCNVSSKENILKKAPCLNKK